MKTFGVITLTAVTTVILTVALIGVLIYRTPVDDMAGAECGPRTEVVAALKQKFGQKEGFVGVVTPKAVMEILFNDETGTWTALKTTSDGQACVTVQTIERISQNQQSKGLRLWI